MTDRQEPHNLVRYLNALQARFESYGPSVDLRRKMAALKEAAEKAATNEAEVATNGLMADFERRRAEIVARVEAAEELLEERKVRFEIAKATREKKEEVWKNLFQTLRAQIAEMEKKKVELDDKISGLQAQVEKTVKEADEMLEELKEKLQDTD